MSNTEDNSKPETDSSPELDLSALPEKLQKLVLHSKHFHMHQVADINNDAIYNHVVYLTNAKCHEIFANGAMKGDVSIFQETNTVLKDQHIQIFIPSDSKINRHKNPLITPTHSRTAYPYQLVDDPQKLFSGLLIVGPYHILINSTESSYPVYVTNGDIVSVDGNMIEYICFARIGYLITPVPYTETELADYEKKHGLSFGPKLRHYLSQQSRILNINDKLYTVDLSGPGPTTQFPFLDISNINNNKHKIQLERLRLKRSTMSKDAYQTAVDEIHTDETRLFTHIFDGMLEIGKLSATEKLYLLINYRPDTNTVDYDASVWLYTENPQNNGFTYKSMVLTEHLLADVST